MSIRSSRCLERPRGERDETERENEEREYDSRRRRPALRAGDRGVRGGSPGEPNQNVRLGRSQSEKQGVRDLLQGKIRREASRGARRRHRRFGQRRLLRSGPREAVEGMGGRVRGKSALDRPCRGSVPIREGREKMTTLRHQIRIEAPIEAVWKAVSVLTEVQHYTPMGASARFISDRREGVGATRRCELKPKGWVEERVWEWSPPHVIGLEVAASEWPISFMKWRTRLESDGKATRINQDLDSNIKFGP